MNKLFLLSALILLLFCAGCGAGSSSSSGGFGGGGTSGSFSNASLKGNYAYEIAGYDLSTGQAVPFREEGAFVADGSGNITGGEDDFAEGSQLVHNVVTTTTTGAAYSVSSDGTALLTLVFNTGGGLQVALSVVSSPTVYLAVTAVEPGVTQLVVNGTGFAVPQTTSAFAAAPSGTFVFRTQNLNTTLGLPVANVGALTVSSGAVSAGSEDQLIFGAADNQLTLTGAFNAPDSLGRGTGTLTDNNGVPSAFYYYMVDSNHLHFFSSTPGTIGVGRAVAQTSTSLSSGSYVFGSKGDDSTLGGVNTVGQFAASGGSISSGGSFDSVQDAQSPVSGTFTGGTYTAASNGRVVVSLTPSSGNSISEIYWVVSPSLAFFITNDPTKVEAGTATLQSSTSFTKSSVSGTFGFAMDGFTTVSSLAFYDRVGNLHWDGAGNLGLTEVVNVSGSPSTSGTLMGTYTVGSNGRAVGNISGLSSNLVVYLASGSEGYMLQGDSGVEINGMMGTAP